MDMLILSAFYAQLEKEIQNEVKTCFGSDDEPIVAPQVSLASQKKKTLLPDSPQRFDSCVCILGKQSFTSGRRYWVVQVGSGSESHVLKK